MQLRWRGARLANAASGWGRAAAGFRKILGVPVLPSNEGWLIKLAYAIATGRDDVEVKPPINMMVVPVADAAALDRGEAETGTNGSVGRETPFTHVTIPAGFHLAYKNHLRAGDVDAYTEEVARVRARIHNGLGFAVAKHETRSDDLACCLDLTLLVLPVPVGPDKHLCRTVTFKIGTCAR